MQLTKARIIGAPRQVKTQYGDRIVFDVLIGGRDEVAIWRPARDTHLLSLKMSDTVTLGIDSKGKHHLVDEPGDIIKAETVAVTETAKPRSKADSSIPPETKKAIATYVQDLADLYGFCHQTAGTINGLTDNDRRQVATTLFIATRDKFSL